MPKSIKILLQFCSIITQWLTPNNPMKAFVHLKKFHLNIKKKKLMFPFQFEQQIYAIHFILFYLIPYFYFFESSTATSDPLSRQFTYNKMYACINIIIWSLHTWHIQKVLIVVDIENQTNVKCCFSIHLDFFFIFISQWLQYFMLLFV